jgi:CheY-like chemotaxis protein
MNSSDKKAETDKPVTILLVDDDADCRLLVREAISSSRVPAEIMEAPDGKTALEMIFRCGKFKDTPKPGLIFLDIEMPGMSGQEVLRRLKSSGVCRDIPIVMLSGLSDEEQMRQAARNGANSYTLKPVDADQFLQTVTDSANYWLNIHQYPHRHPGQRPGKH